MPGDIKLGVRLTADGKGFVGGVTISEKALKKFAATGRRAAKTSRDVARSTDAVKGAMEQMGRSVSVAHGRIAGYVGSAIGIHQLGRAFAAVRDATVRQEQALAQVEARMRSTQRRRRADHQRGSIRACAGEPKSAGAQTDSSGSAAPASRSSPP